MAGQAAAPPRPHSRSIVSRFEASIASGCAGHGVITTPATASPAARAASTVSSVWLIVPEARPRGHHEREPQLDGQVAHEVVRA